MNIQLTLAALLPQQGTSTAETSNGNATGSTSFAAVLGQALQPSQDPLAALKMDARALPQTGLVLQTVLGDAGPLTDELALEGLELDVPAIEGAATQALELGRNEAPAAEISSETEPGLAAENAVAALNPETIARPLNAQAADNAAAASDAQLRQAPGLVSDNPLTQEAAKQTSQTARAGIHADAGQELQTLELAAKPASHSNFETSLQQLASSSQSLSTGAVARPVLTAPLASPQWQNDLSQQVSSFVMRGDNRVSLQLNPADLGPLQVELKVIEQSAQLQFISGQAAVRSAVEQAIPQLRDALAEQGIDLGDVNVGEHSRQQEQSSSTQRNAMLGGVEGDVEMADAAEQEVAGSAATLPGQVSIYV